MAGVRPQCREVVGEDVGRVVDGVLCTADTSVAGAEIAASVKRGALVGNRSFLLATQPWALSAAGRNQDPLVGERVVAAMRSDRQCRRRQALTAISGPERDAPPTFPGWVSAIATSAPSSTKVERASELSPSSLMTTSALDKRAMVETPVTPHFV